MKQVSRWMMAAVLMALLGGCSGEDGMLKINSSPADAEIYIDGDRKGNTPSKKGQTFAIKVSSGEHKVEIIKPIEDPDKYDQYYGEKSVVVAEKSLQTVSLSLERQQSEAYKVKLDERLRLKAEAVAKARKAAAEVLAKVRKPAIHSIESNFVMIPSGSFMMGSNSGDSNEKPVHRVQVNSFKMSKYKITEGVWLAMMGKNSSKSKRDNRPVVQVSWDEIQRFLSILNKASGKHFRLPSEAEWEYAARAGSAIRYSRGDAVSHKHANCDGCSSQWDNAKTAPVGLFSPNKFGLYDMQGNVWEWVHDRYHNSYKGAPNDGSAWDRGSDYRRVLRNPSRGVSPVDLRSTSRSKASSDSSSTFISFRLVQD